MIDIKFLREHPDVVRASQKGRGESVELVDQILAIDEKKRAAVTEFETLRQEQNTLSKSVGVAKGDEKAALLENAKALADKVKAADTKRASYTVRHLAVINKAIADGMDIRGYTAWSLTDNLEWVLGYEPRYGLYSYDPVTLARTPRPSVSLIKDIFTGNAISADVFRTYVKDVRSQA